MTENLQEVQDRKTLSAKFGLKRLHAKTPLRLLIYDGLIVVIVHLFALLISDYRAFYHTFYSFFLQLAISLAAMFGARFMGRVYTKILRYAGADYYLHFIISDVLGGILYFLANAVLYLLGMDSISFMAAVCVVESSLLLSCVMRLAYRYMYQSDFENSRYSRPLEKLYLLCAGGQKKEVSRTANADMELVNKETHRINVMIVGAGRVGVMLAGELLDNPDAIYRPICFVDVDNKKIGRKIFNLSILAEDEINTAFLNATHIHEAIIAFSSLSFEKQKELYERYTAMGLTVKAYDYPKVQSIQGGKRQLRNFDMEELLFRKHKVFLSNETKAFYRNKVVLISGGGGSIGSELCRQIATMYPKKIVILDEYENGAYDIQQEMRLTYGSDLNLCVEIATVCDKSELEHAFIKHHPDIVLHAAAHKHVPLMETNCIEAVRNNVFGTLNIVETAEKFGVSKFIMISTDKAVNPTNVMGATKRMCEMIVLSRRSEKTIFSATRFGNVLGSNGSVIPLFQKQIAGGGPVTITDKRIIRYFMTIPEAAQLVLTSGAMAAQSELYVLDMGKPVKIYDLAKNMIQLSGYTPGRDIQIVETGLRPGEKLYEELLIKSETLSRTQNEMIYVEKDTPLCETEIAQKLSILRKALESDNEVLVREALKKVVPTFYEPGTINCKVERENA